jgi:hypothetical protein
MDDGTDLGLFQGVVRSDCDLASLGPFATPAQSDPAQGAERNPAGYSMEPSRQCIGIMDGARPAGQEHERHLEGVFSKVPIGQKLKADPQNHVAVTLDQGCKRRL